MLAPLDSCMEITGYLHSQEFAFQLIPCPDYSCPRIAGGGEDCFSLMASADCKVMMTLATQEDGEPERAGASSFSSAGSEFSTQQLFTPKLGICNKYTFHSLSGKVAKWTHTWELALSSLAPGQSEAN